VGLLGLMLMIPAAACGRGNVPLLNAYASYACLKHRPEYRPIGWYPGKPGAPPAGPITFEPLEQQPDRVAFDPLTRYLVPNYQIILTWYSSKPILLPPTTSLSFFDTLAAARASWKRDLPRTPPATRHLFMKIHALNRNVFINWVAPYVVPKPVRAIVLGCLRTKSG
jgi:hypothetical protein